MPSKGSATARGYGTAHAKLRKQWETKVQAGLIDCARCGLPIQPAEAWHLDHTDDRTAYLGPSHLACNVAAGGRAGQAAHAGWSQAW